MKNIKFLTLILSCILIIPSCRNDDDNTTPSLPGDIKDITFINTTSYTDWIYFSFSKGETIPITDYQNDLSWDIAFHRGDIRLNGGESGKGKAEAINTNNKDWNSVIEAPASGYIKDKVGEITTAFTGTGIKTEHQPFSQTLSGWLTVDTSNPPPKYTVNKWVYIVKAANGNYVKLYLYDNKNEKNAAGYVSFKYQYNASGSNKFN